MTLWISGTLDLPKQSKQAAADLAIGTRLGVKFDLEDRMLSPSKLTRPFGFCAHHTNSASHRGWPPYIAMKRVTIILTHFFLYPRFVVMCYGRNAFAFSHVDPKLSSCLEGSSSDVWTLAIPPLGWATSSHQLFSLSVGMHGLCCS